MLKFEPINESLAVAEYAGGRVNRIYDGRGYSFTYLSEECAEAVREYALREEIPLVFVGVPREALGALLSGYRHADIDAEDSGSLTYRVSLKSEISLISEFPTAECSGVVLGEILDKDIPDYARLSRETADLGVWGYDYREDIKEPSDEYFLSEARADFARGAAMSLAVRYEGKFIGEAVLYRFDLSGGADIAIRLLPEWRSRGLGSHALSALLSVAEDIGLVKLRAEVMHRNLPSIALFSSFMDEVGRDGERVYFELSAEEDE